MRCSSQFVTHMSWDAIQDLEIAQEGTKTSSAQTIVMCSLSLICTGKYVAAFHNVEAQEGLSCDCVLVPYLVSMRAK